MLLGLQGMVLGLTGCTDYEGVGRDQLAAATVAGDFEPAGQGVQEGAADFAFRLYVGPRKALRGDVVEPPSDRYEPFRLPSSWHEGWRVLSAWRGPSSDRAAECLVAAEVATDLDDLPAELAGAREDEIRRREAVLLRLSASCSDAAHTFD